MKLIISSKKTIILKGKLKKKDFVAKMQHIKSVDFIEFCYLLNIYPSIYSDYQNSAEIRLKIRHNS